MSKLRRGNAPTITRGPFAGEIVEVDHIIPRSVAPELDEKLFNLECIPRSMNRRKRDLIGPRQQALAKEWAAQGLLGRASTAQVLAKQSPFAGPLPHVTGCVFGEPAQSIKDKGVDGPLTAPHPRLGLHTVVRDPGY